MESTATEQRDTDRREGVSEGVSPTKLLLLPTGGIDMSEAAVEWLRDNGYGIVHYVAGANIGMRRRDEESV